MRYEHCAFGVEDVDSAIEFYTNVVGFELLSIDISEEHGIKFAFLQMNGSKIELLEDLRGDFVRPNIKEPYCQHYCIEVDDMDAAIENLKEKGVKIEYGPTACAAGEIILYFKDIDGNVIEYLQWVK